MMRLSFRCGLFDFKHDGVKTTCTDISMQFGGRLEKPRFSFAIVFFIVLLLSEVCNLQCHKY